MAASETRVGGRTRWPSGGAVQGVAAALPVLVVALVFVVGTMNRQGWGAYVVAHPALSAWITVFVAIALQAFPFLMLGVVLAAAVAVFVPVEGLARCLPRRQAAAVPTAGLAGAVLPGCECASVPLARSLMLRGVPHGAALTFLLAAPAINPVVLTSTAVAFDGDLRVVLARFVASLLTSVGMGWWWLRWGRDDLIRLPVRGRVGAGRRERFVSSVTHDLLHAGGFLVVGAAAAATISVLVPPTALSAVAGNPALAVVALAAFAVVIAVCSEADAFVAAGLPGMPMIAKLAFMVVGPALDVKLFAMQVGTFGRSFALRFAPMTFLVAVASAVLVGLVLL